MSEWETCARQGCQWQGSVWKVPFSGFFSHAAERVLAMFGTRQVYAFLPNLNH